MNQQSKTAVSANPTVKDMEEIFLQQKKACDKEPYPSRKERSSNLKSLKKLLKDHDEAIIKAISKDFGNRSNDETELLEIFPSLNNIRYALKRLRRWMRNRTHLASFWFLPGRTKIVYQPLGVVGIIVPWNYPLLLLIGPLVSALAAGNRVMIKVSEFTPETSSLLKNLMSKYFDEEQVTIIEGDTKVAQKFASLPWDHLLFTGSTPVGHQIMHAASQHLTPVTLELGGKSPAWISKGFAIERATQSIMFGKCVNAGQTCIAPDYVLVSKEQLSEFIECARKTFLKLYPDFPDTKDYTHIINEKHYKRLKSLLKDAEDKGAKLIPLYKLDEVRYSGQLILPPTLITDTTPEMRIMQEEIFGPILPIVTCEGYNEAKNYINERPKPLALYYFDTRRNWIDKVLKETVAGGVTINDTLLHMGQEHLPFGGVGASGMGHYHGKDGFETFSKKKGVFIQFRFNFIPLVMPPYGKFIRFFLDLLKR
ncbi:MAG: coniferyl aldehyde dehydrogenase [Proteobacteria bacterium]|nr:coniferyl aldehyde dehydrogenase [Pseudomonadota bacterium]